MVDILMVEDNREIGTLLCDFLRAEGYTVTLADTGEKALSSFQKYGARLVLLDIMLPGMDGFALCRGIREQAGVPIFMISARTDREDKLNGLLLGADDYIEKPFDIEILLAKIRGVFRRRYAEDTVSDGSLVLNRATRTAWKDSKALDLTAKEFDLLLLLLENKGKPLSKDFLFSRVWGFDSISEQQTLTVHIKRLRQKIEDDPKNPAHILTLWGMGYKYESEAK